MTELMARPKRIVVVARPKLGRSLEAALRGAGYEVHRTPDSLDVDVLATRLRPDLIIVALDLPWVDAFGTVGLLAQGEQPRPVLLLGDAGSDPRANGTPQLPLTVDEPLLLATVDGLLAADEHEPER